MALRALCIGVNDYPGTGLDLNGCVNDAHDWAAELQARGFNVSTLLDRQATGRTIRARIADAIDAGARGDTVLVQFSGHGSFVPDLNGDEPDTVDECLCPWDIRNDYITDDELFSLFAAARQGVRVIFIADSCHSGTIARLEANRTAVPESPCRRIRFLPPAAFLGTRTLALLSSARAQRRSKPPRYAALTLSGCRDSESSYDDYFDGRPNGAFTYTALRTLRSLPAGATYAAWHAAIRTHLPSAKHPQTPCIDGARLEQMSAVN